jgi:uncharacterized LabA/DUF88 family protein
MIPIRMKVYVDYWNVQSNLWKVYPNDQVRIRWHDLGAEALRVVRGLRPAWAGMTAKGTELFASKSPEGVRQSAGKTSITRFLEGLRDYGIVVHIAERKLRDASLYCRVCAKTISTCHHCNTSFVIEKEKGVDIELCTTIYDDLADGVCDGVIIMSQDEDFVPLATSLRKRGVPVINLGFSEGGHPLAEACDELVTIQEIFPRIHVNAGQFDSRA